VRCYSTDETFPQISNLFTKTGQMARRLVDIPTTKSPSHLFPAPCRFLIYLTNPKYLAEAWDNG
jgi:hypothetical protein